ncbi:MAG TPA: glycosyltransferase family 2 protein [Acidobacteriota bacterium]|nr:glycosyltransferase family 2 protein [Acidobacteriota bacterium]
MNPRVLVSIVTFNSARYLESCLRSLEDQTFRDFITCLWDNASTDRTPEIVADFGGMLHTSHFATGNIGFCAAHNRIIAANPSDYVMVLNPDVKLDPGFLDTLVQALDRDGRAGSATGKLWRWPADSTRERLLDTTGIYMTRNQRHLDRGSEEPDRGQYDKREYVFGASGAAAFYRRAMLEEVQAGGQYFDEDFFAYREDADLAWRAQWIGWRCLYVPEATGYHVRFVFPDRRAQLPAEINMHSFKNRFLMRVKNMDRGTYARFFVPITMRDAAALGYVLVREWPSLRALPLFLRALPRARAVRRALRRHRRVSPEEIRWWFSNRPRSMPVS